MPAKKVSIDNVLIADVERLKNGAHVHWVNSTLHRYRNGDPNAEEHLRKFVADKGKFKKMTPEQLTHAWNKLKYPPERLPAALDELEKDPEWG